MYIPKYRCKYKIHVPKDIHTHICIYTFVFVHTHIFVSAYYFLKLIPHGFIFLLFRICLNFRGASLVAQMVKNLYAMHETWVQSLGWEDPLEKGTAAHSSMLAWRIPRTISERV